jgi:hypothetical protein
MIMRSSWRYHDDDPAPRRSSYTAAAWAAAVVFAVVWVVVSAFLLATLALRFF